MTLICKQSCRKWITLIACCGFCFLYPLSFSTTGLFLVDLAPHYGMGHKAITWVAACQSGLGGTFGLIIGISLKKFGVRIVGTVVTVLNVLGLLTAPLVDNIYYLYISYGLIFGIGSISLCFIGFTTAFKTFPENQAAVSGLLATSISVGGFAWAPLIQLLIEHFTWKGALILLSGIHLHGILLTLLLGKQAPTSKQTDCNKNKEVGIAEKGGNLNGEDKVTVLSNVHRNGKEMVNGTTREQLEKLIAHRSEESNNTGIYRNEKAKVHFEQISNGSESREHIAIKQSRREPNWCATAIVFLTASTLLITCHMNFYTYIPILNAQNGFSKQKGAFLISIVNISSALVRLPAGLLGNLRCVSCSLLYALSVLCAASISMSSVLLTTYPSMMVMCAIFGLSAGVYMSLQNPSLMENFPRKHTEVAIGTNMSLQGMSIFILHGSAGFILDAVGDSNVLFFIYGSCGLLCGCLVMSLVFIKLGYSGCRRI